jgi:hypothetical protein
MLNLVFLLKSDGKIFGLNLIGDYNINNLNLQEFYSLIKRGFSDL